MKIGISGTQGVGKSYLLYKVANKCKLLYPNKEVTVVNETARKCPMPINEESTIEAQQWMFSNQIQREIEAENNCDIVICDRTLADYMAYIKNKNKTLFNTLFPYLKYHISSYDLIIYKSLENNKNYLIDDGKRSVNKKFQKEIDDILFNIYTSLMPNINRYKIV